MGKYLILSSRYLLLLSNLSTGISDHFLDFYFTFFHAILPNLPAPYSPRYCHHLCSLKKENFLNDLYIMLSVNPDLSSPFDLCLVLMTQTFLTCFDKHVPLILKTLSSRLPSLWFNTDLFFKRKMPTAEQRFAMTTDSIAYRTLTQTYLTF